LNDIIKAEDSQPRVSAQVPVNTRVSSNAKRLKAVIAEEVIPAMVKAIKSEKTSPETVVKLGDVLTSYHLGLEKLVENTLTDRLRIELQAFGPTVKAKEVKQVDDEEDDHFDGPSLTDDIIAV
jgi:hypothetical protein